MLKFFIGLFYICTCAFGYGQVAKNLIKDAKGKPMLLGQTTEEDLSSDIFPWYRTNYDTYILNERVCERIKDNMNELTVKVFYGTWCGDSRREIPKFYKVMHNIGLPRSAVRVYAVDRSPEAYKKAPNGEEKGLNIHRVPTFIFYKSNKEIGRIVEYPKQDMERDILDIVTGKQYSPNYAMVAYLHSIVSTKGLKYLKDQENNLLQWLPEYTMGSRELNTYGYKLLRSDQTETAIFMFTMNAKMYPYVPNVYLSLAEAFAVAKNYKSALVYYQKAAERMPKNKLVKQKIEELSKQIKKI